MRDGNLGAVYVFSEPASGWTNETQTAVLTASDGGAYDHLGGSVAISGSMIIAGAPGKQIGSNEAQGTVYLFSEPASGWANETQTAELTASDGGFGDGLGTSVAVSGSTIIAGAPFHEVGSNVGQGAVYVFSEPASGWADATQTAELTATDGGTHDLLGFSVAIQGSTIVAGAPLHQEGVNPGPGAVYVFIEPTSGWGNATQSAELSASGSGTGLDLGRSVAIADSIIVAGAPQETVGANLDEGALYVFDKPASGWTNANQSAAAHRLRR